MPPVPTAAERAKPARKAAARRTFRERIVTADRRPARPARRRARGRARTATSRVRLRAEGALAEVAAAFNALVERNQR